MALQWDSSSDDSGSESNYLPTVPIKSEPVTIKTEPITYKSEPLSENESGDESDISINGHPNSSLTSGDFSSMRFGGDESRTIRRHERRPIRSNRHGTLLGDSPIPSTSNHTATGYSPYSNVDVDYHTLNGFVPEAIAMKDGLSIRHEHSCTLIPHEEVPNRIIFTGPSSIAVSLGGSHQGWIHIPNGITADDRVNRRCPTTTLVPVECLKEDGILPPFPVITSVPSENPINGVSRTFRIDSVPPPVHNNNVPPTNPIDSVPPAIPIDSVTRAILIDSVPPAIPIDSVPPAIPIDNVPINIKYEINSDEEDDANNHNMYTNVAADDYNEFHTDVYNNIDMEAIEAKENLVLRSIESNEEPVMERSESNEEPVVERSESNEEPIEKKSIPLAISSSEHFLKEICQKDPCDPTFADGFEIDQIMNPKLRDDDTFMFEVKWRHENFSGIDALEAPIIYDHWPDVALKFFRERYPEDNDKKKE